MAFRGTQVPDPPPASANDGPRTLTGLRRGAGWKPKVAFGQLDEISPNFLFCIPEGPTGGVASSF